MKDALKVIRRGLHRAGIAIPTLEPSITTEESGRLSSDALPDAEAFPLMALAQHHGVPTLMLDWSRRGLVAAYFASSDAAARLLKPEQIGSHLSIWALQRSATDPVDGRYEVLLTEAYGAGNPNLNAQAGLFTVSLDEDARPLVFVLRGKAAFRRIHAPPRSAVPVRAQFRIRGTSSTRRVGRLHSQPGYDFLLSIKGMVENLDPHSS